MPALRRSVLRAGNALRRMASGLPPTGGIVSPEVPDDLFQAHRSLYRFAARFAGGKRVLDLGCGTGYGAPELVAGGALSVLGIDRDPRLVRYAARRFGRHAGVEFRAGDPEALPADLSPDPGRPGQPGTFGLVLALGLLPRLADPGRALDGVRERLEPGGVLVVSLPPILDGQTLDIHRARPGEPSSSYLWDWESELAARFPAVRLFRHLPPAGRLPAMDDPRPSSLDPASFRFEEIPRAEIYDVGHLTALFVCEG